MKPGTHRVRAYAFAAELARPRLHHADHAELARGVIRLAEVSVETDDRRRVQNDARLLREHRVHDRLRAVVHAFQIDLDDAVELVLGHVLQLRVHDDARVVDEAIDTSPFRERHVDHLLERLACRARRRRNRTRRRASPCTCGRVSSIDSGRQIADDHFRAFAGELDRGRLADAAARAGDDRHLVLESHLRISLKKRCTNVSEFSALHNACPGIMLRKICRNPPLQAYM